MMRGLKKSKNRLLLGVAGGIAAHFKVDPVIVRAIFILLALANGVGVLLYIVLALLMPRADTTTTEPFAVVKENLTTAPREATEAGRRVVEVLRGSGAEEKESEETSAQRDGDEVKPAGRS